MQKNAITPEGPVEAEADKSPDTKDPKDSPKVDEKKDGPSETGEAPKGSGERN